jgi:hypothetical protein
MKNMQVDQVMALLCLVCALIVFGVLLWEAGQLIMVAAPMLHNSSWTIGPLEVYFGPTFFYVGVP